MQDSSIARWTMGATGMQVVETLFGESSLSRDRTMLGKEENAQIDRLIEIWLTRMAGLLLDRNVSKCIEWLVRRFR